MSETTDESQGEACWVDSGPSLIRITRIKRATEGWFTKRAVMAPPSSYVETTVSHRTRELAVAHGAEGRRSWAWWIALGLGISTAGTFAAARALNIEVVAEDLAAAEFEAFDKLAKLADSP